MTILIDLRKFREPLAAEIQRSLIDFSVQHPNVEVCTVGIAGDGFHGLAALFLDTPEHSAAHVEEYLKHGIGWYGEDENGRFCNSCPDFPYCIGEYCLPDYPDFYQSRGDISIDYITLDGNEERVEIDEGDEGMNRLVFPFLKTIIASFQPFTLLLRAIPFRVGVQMHDSRYEEFWSVEVEKRSS